MASASRVVLLACLPVLVSCGPSLAERGFTTRSFTSPVPCAQGPFELHATTLPSLWGQVLRVGVSGPATVHVAIWIDGAQVAGGKIMGPDKSTSCQLDASERGQGPSAGGAVVPSAGAPPAGDGSAVLVKTSAPALVEAPLILPREPMPYEFGRNEARPEMQTVVWQDVAVNASEDMSRVSPAGRDVKILVWADSLQDFRTSQIVVFQSVLRPSGSDAEYLAYLRQDHDKHEAEARKRELEAAQFARDCAARVAKNDVDSGCHDKAYRNANYAAECEALAARNAVNSECRADGYRNAWEKAENARCEALRVFDSACCREGRACWKANAPAASRAPETASPRPSLPPGPPPLPQVEAPPPQPSVHAEWIPGSWTWDGFAWQWLSGGWRVPDADIAWKATATAPALPPPPQTEPIPPRPCATVEWTPGYWHWSGGRWIWVRGRWAMAPSLGLTWHPSVWIVDGGRVRLDPGRWIAR